VAHDFGKAAGTNSGKLGEFWWAEKTDSLPQDHWLIGIGTEHQPSFSLGISLRGGHPEVVVALADGLQGHLLGYEHLQLPACPGHSHPMIPSASDGEAVWRCPASGKAVVMIGQLS
jgi:hypothetical protein